MKQLPMRFRTRLFVTLSLFALLPAILLTLLWVGMVQSAVPLLNSAGAWSRVATTGQRAITAARRAPLTAAQRTALTEHENELRRSLELSKRYDFLAPRYVDVILAGSVLALLLMMLGASRVAGHLSRQLSRPLDEVVHWTELIGRGKHIPDVPPRRGAPEFETLRRHMRAMEHDLSKARAQAVEAERLRAFRESARQVAHELKNPLTPIRFAVERLRRNTSPDLAETIEVLDVESRRLERMARSFAQFGRLPEGPVATIDVGELVRYVAASTAPERITVDVDVAPNLALLQGHHDALAGALSNIVLNAIDACRDGDRVTVSAAPAVLNGNPAVRIAVRDTGCGMSPDVLARIWEPYMTQKPGGTGLGLAIALQSVRSHGGDVSAVSEVGKGTEISMILPISS
jgi:signal transduction histidine kinase